jgi:tetratricopeptide (TPR) repeat protein
MIDNNITHTKAAGIIAAAIMTLLTLSLSAQEEIAAGSPAGSGEDSLRCAENTSLYLSYYQKKDFNTAVSYWRQVFNECPSPAEDLYIDGETMFKELYRSTGDAAYIDSLIMTVSEQVYYFDNKPSHYLRLSQYLSEVAGDNPPYVECCYILIKEVADSFPDEVDYDSSVMLADAANRAFLLGIIDTTELVAAYTEAIGIADKHLADHPDDSHYVNATEEIYALLRFGGAMKCKSIEMLFSDKVDKNITDSVLVGRVFAMLAEKGCTGTDLYYRLAARQFALRQSVENAVRLAELNIERKNTDKATWYFSEAYKLDTNRIVRSDVLAKVAAWELESGKREEARDHGEQAYRLNNKNGKALLIIAEAYAGSDIGDRFDNHSAYWVAVDYLRSAKSIDPSLAKTADEKMKIYSKLFPTREECFYKRITEEGIVFRVGGWINEVTRVRFRQE